MSRSPSFPRSSRNHDRPAFTHHHSTSNPTNRPSLSPPPQDDSVRRSSSLSAQLRGMRRLEQRRNMEENHYLSCKARAQNFNPPVDLRLLDYVSPFDSNLMCPICRCAFIDPVILTECDHCFCRDCIRQTWNTNTNYTPLGPRGDCPTCRTPAKLGPRSATSKILVNIVDELLVKCPKSDDGCKAEIRRCEVQDHVGIYCGYALVECIAEHCDLPVRRKDAAQGCLHYGVSCLRCHAELQKWKLELHWRSECPDRKIHCELCKEPVFHRELDEHNRETCPAISIPCPGKAFGCTTRGKRAQADVHAKTCIFAKLAPVLLKQQERLDEQEVAQKQMCRKLEVLESGFSSMQGILYPPERMTTVQLLEERGGDPDRASADESRIPLLQGRHTRLHSNATVDSATETEFLSLSNSPSSTTPPQQPFHPTLSPLTRPAPQPPGPRPTDLPEPYTTDFDLAFPPPTTTGGPYASPLHHLLSMHESLRDELSRVAAGLAELDGRHSMQNLNENLRTREEISYIGAQVAGLQRQVHWLTSAQLQRAATPGGASSRDGGGMADAGAGAGVEAAVSTAATALRGAARVVNVGVSQHQHQREGMGMRRGPSEEGRTKL